MEAAVKLDFMALKRAVASQWERMQKHSMFRVEIDKDKLWATYIAAFPEGTNPKYRERTEHDCSCCKQFIRAVGDTVAVINGEIVTVWDVTVKDEPAYTKVAKAMSDYVKSLPIKDFFLHYDRLAGTDRNFEKLVEGQQTWNHFFVNIAANFVLDKSRIPSKLNDLRTARSVLHRSLTGVTIGAPVLDEDGEVDVGGAITLEAVDTVLDLIAQNSLYRGSEQKFVVSEFRKVIVEFNRLTTDAAKDRFSWTASESLPGSVSRIRNSSIGKLLVDISADVDLEVAVKKFESKLAPANYKRPTALVSKAQIEKAKTSLQELGLMSALERRYANIGDITVNNVLFRDRSVKEAMGDVFDTLATTSTNLKAFDKVEEVPVARFLEQILPRAESIEVFVENRFNNNLVSLIAAADATAAPLFKWGNKFSWSYIGEMADSIKERVKKAGGSVVGDLCCRLAWDYRDDLDFWMKEPGGHTIYFGNRNTVSPNGGKLDVDANGGSGMMDEPVENIFYASQSKMREGTYELSVNNYTRRDNDKRGFEVEVEFDGQTFRFAYEKALRTGETVQVAKIKYSKKSGFEIIESLPSSQSTKTFWGVQTQQFHKVSAIMNSPNYWDGETGVGNNHLFFMLEGCKNDGTARGFFNEFLKSELDPHRKVLEMVGSKMKVADSTDQLSGLGFSSTKKETLICRVKGSFSRPIKIVF